MYEIEIDFEVYKKLTNMRESEGVTYNDVLRKLLALGSGMNRNENDVSSPVSGSWTAKGVEFPAGTEFRARHKGTLISGQVRGGALCVNGKSFTSPSKAANEVTGNSVNGWIFWECRFPGKTSWQVIASLRKER